MFQSVGWITFFASAVALSACSSHGNAPFSSTLPQTSLGGGGDPSGSGTTADTNTGGTADTNSHPSGAPLPVDNGAGGASTGTGAAVGAGAAGSAAAGGRDLTAGPGGMAGARGSAEAAGSAGQSGAAGTAGSAASAGQSGAAGTGGANSTHEEGGGAGGAGASAAGGGSSSANPCANVLVAGSYCGGELLDGSDRLMGMPTSTAHRGFAYSCSGASPSTEGHTVRSQDCEPAGCDVRTGECYP